MKLTIIIPVYEGQKFLKENNDQWETLCKRYQCIFIEDSLDKKSKTWVNKIGGEYYSKPNCRWGSVINYAKNNVEIAGGYVTIFDQDDIIDIKDLDKTVSNFKNSDIYSTNVIKKGSIEKKIVYNEKTKVVPFIHSLYFSNKIFNKIPDLLEDTPFTDEQLKIYLYNIANTIEYIDTAPYIHIIDTEHQTSGKKNTINGLRTKSYIKIINELQYHIDHNSSKQIILSYIYMLEYCIFTTKNNKELIKQYKKIWSIKNRGFFTAPIFVKLVSLFKKKHI